MKQCVICLLCCLFELIGYADIVHVFEQTETDGQAVQISDRQLITGMPWSTQTAPIKSGYIFTHWTISTKQDFESRDEWGRAFDVATFMLYEDTTLTAHYLPETLDEDGDGVADGYEIYWYGNLNQGPLSDTDEDGFTFAEELANGTNPVMPDDDDEGPVRYVDGSLLQYNPLNMPSCIFRSEPEGVLFATKADVVRAGTFETSEDIGSFSSGTAKFAYWLVNGVAQRDEWGRTIDVIAFNMPTVKVEVVAVTASDEETRQKLYWYGRTDVSMESDTDGDGMTFAEELVAGLNPLMPDDDDEGPVRYADGQILQYNPWNMYSYTIRSDPEGALCATVTEYVKAGLMVEPASYSPCSSTFAYWKMNGVALRDEFGRAIDSGAFQMPTTSVELVAVSVADANDRQKIYWYGTTGIPMESDTDGDGFSFAEELANGTNPLMYDDEDEGPVRYADSALHETNLQPYEQVTGAVVDEKYEAFPTFEGAANFHDVYMDALIGKGGRENLMECFEFPEAHQVFVYDKRRPRDAQLWHLLGEYEKSAAVDTLRTDWCYWKALSLRKLGREAEARAIGEAMVKKGSAKLDDYVYVELTDEIDIPDAVMKLRGTYKNLMTLTYDNTRTRMQSTKMEAVNVKEKSPMELFAV